MSAKANDVVCTLYDRFLRECRQLTEIRDEMKNISDAYFRYCDLRGERERVRALIVEIHRCREVFAVGFARVRKGDISPTRDVRRDATRFEDLGNP